MRRIKFFHRGVPKLRMFYFSPWKYFLPFSSRYADMNKSHYTKSVRKTLMGVEFEWALRFIS